MSVVNYTFSFGSIGPVDSSAKSVSFDPRLEFLGAVPIHRAAKRLADPKYDEHQTAIRRFRRAMRRHEKRARRLGFRQCALTLTTAREGTGRGWAEDERWMRDGAAQLRRDGGRGRQVAWFYERAAEALAKLRAAL